MSTRVTPAVLNDAKAATCSDFQGHRLAVGMATGAASVFGRAPGDQGWQLSAAWPAHDNAVTQIAWADAAFGAVLATSCGTSISIWRESCEASMHPSWELQATLPAVPSHLVSLQFAPVGQNHVWLAAASADGAVRLYSPAEPQLDGSSGWGLQSELWADESGAAGASTCLAWRPPSPNAPAMLAVSNAAGAAVWWHDARHGQWAVTAQLPGPPADAVAWAPVLGRPSELVALGSGDDITVWSLQGPVDALKAEKVAELQAAAPVHQLKFNGTGSWMAASTAAGEVQLCRPALDGSWNLLMSVQGTPDQQSTDQQPLQMAG